MDTFVTKEIPLKSILNKLVDKENLSFAEVYSVLHQFENDPDPVDLTAFLVLLKVKGESGEELATMVKFLSEKMIKVPVRKPTLDIVGTGGDGANTVNISTAAAIVASACSIPVAKHGNRSVSSKCGSADFIESLGIPLELTPEKASQSIETLNITFLYAPIYNPFIKLFQPIRSRLKLRTIFNLIGPLLNPTLSPFRIVGVYDSTLMEPMADALKRIGVTRGLVCNGYNLDELTTLGPAEAIFIYENRTKWIKIDPEKFGFKKSQLSELEGGDPQKNRRLLLEALQTGKGPIADTLALNAGVAVWLYDGTLKLEEGIEKAKETVRSGKAYNKLQEWVDYARSNT